MIPEGSIVFDEASQVNVDIHTGEIHESVTQYVKRHTNSFDADFHAGNYAIKHGMEKQAVLDMWKEKGRLAAIDGTRTHKILETYAINGYVNIVEPCLSVGGVVAFINEQYETKNYIPVKTEFRLKVGCLSGICDVLVMNQKREYFLLDYKTNTEISTKGYGKMMKPPYQYLPDANYYHYSLQLSLYQRMCTEYKIKACYIIHLKEKSYKIITAQNYFKNG